MILLLVFVQTEELTTLLYHVVSVSEGGPQGVPAVDLVVQVEALELSCH